MVRFWHFLQHLFMKPSGWSFVTHDPSAAARANVCNRSIYVPVKTESCLQLPINAIVDLRARNSATLWTDGIDARLGSNVETSLGKFEFSVAGTYILHYKQADTPDAPLVSLLNTLSNPQALHIIGSTSWTIGNAETSLDVQYANRYRDTETNPVSSIASWTTADLRVAYTFGAEDAPRSRPVEVALNCENLFNRYSPFAVNTVASLGYDQENGSLTGRVITLAVDVKWQARTFLVSGAPESLRTPSGSQCKTQMRCAEASLVLKRTAEIDIHAFDLEGRRRSRETRVRDPLRGS
jgi:hypothetical protein